MSTHAFGTRGAPDPSSGDFPLDTASDEALDPVLEPLPSGRTSSARELVAQAPPRASFRARAQPLQNLKSEAVPEQHKRIVICADGTWNTPQQVSAGKPAPTNVWLLWQLVKDYDTNNLPQLAYYHPGVGTGGALDRILGGINGWGLRRNILDCYRFLVEHYQPGDYLYLFGFSRGAYTVRSLAGLIRNSGIIRRDQFPKAEDREAAITAAWRLYRQRGDETAPVARKAMDFRHDHSHHDFRITCVGVWDTVGALGIPVSGLLGSLSRHCFGFHDVTLSSWVDRAFHAVAIDERRGPFVATLWKQQSDAWTVGQQMEQVWFTGVHADVGGGYSWSERGLANLTLRWMVNRVTAFCGLELDVAALAKTPPAQLALHDSLRWWYRLPPLTRPIMRVLDAGLGQRGYRDGGSLTTEQVHASVEWCRKKYCQERMPIVGRAYQPDNVVDYGRRLAKSRQAAPPAGTIFSPDIKMPPATGKRRRGSEGGRVFRQRRETGHRARGAPRLTPIALD